MEADARGARLAAGHNGSLTRTELIAAGLSDDQIDRRLESGLFVPEHRGVYRHAAAPPTWRTQLHAAVLACGGGAAASHRSAGRLHPLDGVPMSRPEVSVAASDLPRHRDVIVHRTTKLETADLCVVGDIPTTTIPRTLLDLGAVMSYEQVEHTVQNAIIRKVVTEGALAAVLERVGGRGRRGSAALRAVLRGAIPDSKLASMLEHKLHELLKLAAFPPPELQYEIRYRDGRRSFIDFAWPQWHLAIEGDGHRWHGTAAQLRKDLARRRSIQAAGWTHYSFGWADVTDSSAATLLELCRVHRLQHGERDKERMEPVR